MNANKKQLLRLESTYKRLENLGKGIRTIEEKIALMESIPIISNYIDTKNGLDEITMQYKQLQFEGQLMYQEACFHPLWYFLDNFFEEPFKGFKCKCVYCGKEDKIKSYRINAIETLENGKLIYALDDFSNKMPIDTSFESIQDEFRSLESEGHNQEEISKILYEKYVVNKENNRTR